jgi:uncharacterized protein (DUF1499 family)
MADTDRSWWAKALLIGAVIAAALLSIGALGSRFGLWGFQTGLLALAAATVLAAIGLLIGVVAIFVSHKRNMTGDKPALSISLGVSTLILALMGVQFYQASSVPAIHNISTDIQDPPQFDAVVALRGQDSNPLEYDSEIIGPVQQAAYPRVQPLTLAGTPGDALSAAIAALKDMGLDIVATDAAAGIVEATATTFWFGFKDDVVVRVRASDDGAVVDVRSVSRVGVSDIGANARRIAELLDRLKTQSG